MAPVDKTHTAGLDQGCDNSPKASCIKFLNCEIPLIAAPYVGREKKKKLGSVIIVRYIVLCCGPQHAPHRRSKQWSVLGPQKTFVILTFAEVVASFSEE